MRLEIHPVDLAIIIAYFVVIIGLGCWAGARQRRAASGEGEGYFLAGKSLTWAVIGLALFSTNISTTHLVALAESGYKDGLVWGNYEWMAAFTLIALALFFAPFYIRSKVATLPDFLEKRYNQACRDWLAIISMGSAVFVHIGFSLFAGATVLEGMFGIPLWWSIIGISILTGLYTVVGGLLAVVLTESLQTIILLAGAICITVVSYVKLGGWSGLTASVPPVHLTVLRPASDPSGLSWYSMFLGYPVIGLWYWCADQTIVQRVLGARDENHARLGPLFAGFIKILPMFIFVLPGVMCLGLIHKGILPSTLTDTKNTYAFMITHLLPVGLRGVVAAALLAALMSTVSGALNSIATLFCYDILKRRKPEIPDGRLVFWGRVVTVIGMLAAMFWSPLISHFSGIFVGIQTMISYIAPPITAVFLLGVFWKKASATGAVVTLWAGFALGMTVFALDWYKASTHWNVPFMLMSFYLFLICCAIHIVVSRLKPQKLSEESAALVWSNPGEALRSPGWPGLGNYKFVSALLLAVMAVLYIVFK